MSQTIEEGAGASGHLTPDELARLCRGKMSVGEIRRAVSHLLQGCEPCLAQALPHLSVPFEAEKASPVPAEEVSPELDAAYEAAIDRAFAAVREVEQQRRESARIDHEIERLLAGAPVPAAAGLSLYERLLERSWELRHEEPGQMVRLARLAVRVAETLDPERHGVAEVADYQGRAWAELGNACRVSDDLDAAQLAMNRAAAHLDQGTGDDLLQARYLDLLASLQGDRRCFDAARRALDLVHSIYARRGDYHLAARALITKGTYTGYAGKPEEAIRLTRRGLELLDRDREPGLVFVAIHNLARWLMDCGRLREAREMLEPQLLCPEQAGGRLNRLKLQWLDGQIALGLGELDRAAEALLEVKGGFEEVRKPYDAAVAALDLATVRLRQGRMVEARDLSLEAADIFSSLRIQREAIGAALLLQAAFDMGHANATLIEDVADFLRRVEKDPTARFQSRLR